MIGPGVKSNNLTLNEEIEVLSAEIEVEYLNPENYEDDEYHIIFPEEI